MNTRISRKSKNHTFCFCTLHRAGGATEEGEFAAFINMCAKTDAAKREKPTSRKGVGFSLKSQECGGCAAVNFADFA